MIQKVTWNKIADHATNPKTTASARHTVDRSLRTNGLAATRLALPNNIAQPSHTGHEREIS